MLESLSQISGIAALLVAVAVAMDWHLRVRRMLASHHFWARVWQGVMACIIFLSIGQVYAFSQATEPITRSEILILLLWIFNASVYAFWLLESIAKQAKARKKLAENAQS